MNVRPETKKRKHKLLNIGLGTNGLNVTPNVKRNRWDNIKRKNFCIAEETNRQKGNLEDGRKYSQIQII